MFSFCTVTRKYIAVFSRNCRYVHHVMGGGGGGGCCIVYDIDGLFEFCIHFFVKKNWFDFLISCFLRVLCYFQHCCVFSKLCRYVHHVMGVCCIVFWYWSDVLFYFFFAFPTKKSFFGGGNIEKCPFTYWLNGRWFLQIVDIIGEFENGVIWKVVSPDHEIGTVGIYIQDTLHSLVLISFSFHVFFTFYAISNIFRNKIFRWRGDVKKHFWC